jgi:ADP-ribose pyrophosphatase YjhB (NUDIX family)
MGRNITSAMGNKDLYFVAVKIFLVDSEGNLLITKDCFGDWDIPGGRLREEDFTVSLEAVAERKIKEELGGNVIYKLGKPALFMRHQRDEILSSGEREKRRIFAVGYSARYQEGEITIGKNHEKYEWVSLKTFVPEDYFTGGWLQGVKEFQLKFGKEI